jgi:acyl-CoA reductase-like NAD-dependent aldehyde dehydrogenase
MEKEICYEDIRKLKYFAAGQWLDSKTDKYMDIYDPSTGGVIAQTPCCTKDRGERYQGGEKSVSGMVKDAGDAARTGAV